MPEDAGVNALAPHVRVREMQTKLHRWAVADPGRRFDDLYNLVCDPAFLLIAWERVAGNSGARTAGVLPPLCRSRLYLSGSSWARW
jgi:RNA-directed DNA polymerase